MEKSHDFLFFIIENQRFAIPLASVKKVLPVVEMRELPDMPPFLHGIINYFGNVLPIINLHYLFNVGVKTIELSDQMIVVRTPKLKLGLLVDKILEVYSVQEDNIKASDPVMYGPKHMQGVIKNEEGIVLISDIDAFLNDAQLADMTKVLAVETSSKVK